MDRLAFFKRARLGVILLPLAGCGGGGGGGGGPASILGAVQNRDVDPQGRSVDFSFSRRMRAPTAGDLASFVSSGGEQAVSATGRRGRCTPA